MNSWFMITAWDLAKFFKEMNEKRAFVRRSTKLVRPLMLHSILLLSQVNGLLWGYKLLKVSQYSILKVAYKAFICSVPSKSLSVKYLKNFVRLFCIQIHDSYRYRIMEFKKMHQFLQTFFKIETLRLYIVRLKLVKIVVKCGRKIKTAWNLNTQFQ